MASARPFKQVAEYAEGRREVAVDITEPVLVDLMARYTNEEALVLSDEVIIGRTILRRWIFTWAIEATSIYQSGTFRPTCAKGQMSEKQV